MDTQGKWELTANKYMNKQEFDHLRKMTEALATLDLAKGRATWVKAWMIIDLVTQTGMRVMELTRVRVLDLYLNRDPHILVIGKKKKGTEERKNREVSIGTALIKHLKDYIQYADLKENDYLLQSSRSKQFTTAGLQQIFKRACEEAGLPKHYSIHAARHSFGTHLYAKYKDLRMVQKQLGHANIQTTTIYSDVSKDAIVNAMNGMFPENEEAP